jgi:hypothetical protein
MSPVEERFRLGGPLIQPWWTKTFRPERLPLSTCWVPARVLVLATYGWSFMVTSPPDDDRWSSDSDPWSEMLRDAHQIAVAKFAVILLSIVVGVLIARQSP